MPSAEEKVREVVAPALAAEGLALEDVSVRQAGNRRLVRVTVDVDLAAVLADADDGTTPIAPLSLDEVADATRVVDDALESSDVLGSAPCTLEVGSPGVSRPLTEQRHYRRNVSRLVAARLTDGSQVTGRIVRAGDRDVDLLVAATKGKDKQPEHTRTLAFDELRSAAVQVEFNRTDPVVDRTDGPENESEAH